MRSRARRKSTYIVYVKGSTVGPKHCVAPFNHRYVVQKFAYVACETIIGAAYTYGYLCRSRVISQIPFIIKSTRVSMTYCDNSFEETQHST